MSNSRRSRRVCAEILYGALSSARELRRRDVVDAGLLSNEEFTRALDALRESGVVRRSPVALGITSDIRFTLTGKRLPAPPGPARQMAGEDQSFSPLLNAWGISLPLHGRVAHGCIEPRNPVAHEGRPSAWRHLISPNEE